MCNNKNIAYKTVHLKNKIWKRHLNKKQYFYNIIIQFI